MPAMQLGGLGRWLALVRGVVGHLRGVQAQEKACLLVLPPVHSKGLIKKACLNSAQCPCWVNLLIATEALRPSHPARVFAERENCFQNSLAVTPGTEQDWVHPPFSGAIEDGWQLQCSDVFLQSPYCAPAVILATDNHTVYTKLGCLAVCSFESSAYTPPFHENHIAKFASGKSGFEAVECIRWTCALAEKLAHAWNMHA
eukprot:1141262-Pelagomonas_calceolata.AAC.2